MISIDAVWRFSCVDISAGARGVLPFPHRVAGMSDYCHVHDCRRHARYAFATHDCGQVACCLRHALVYPPTFWRAVRVAVVVGTILVLINQADVVLAGHLTPVVAAKIVLTYLVPFSVSTYSVLTANQIAAVR